MWKISIARSKVLSNDKNIDIDEVFEYYKELNVKAYQGWAARYIGEIFLNIDDHHISEAEDWFKKAIEVDKKNSTIWSLGSNYAYYAKLFRRRGDLTRFKQNLKKAIEIFKECGARGWAKKYEQELVTFS